MKPPEKMDKRERRLTKAVEQIVTDTDFNASVRIATESDTVAAQNGGFGSSGHARVNSRIVHEEAEKMLPLLLAAYKAERSALWVDQHRLDGIVRTAVDGYFEDLTTRNTKGNAAFGRPEGSYRNLYDERRKLVINKLETNFRYPGLQQPHQRYAIAFALSTLLLGTILGAVLTMVGRILVP